MKKKMNQLALFTFPYKKSHYLTHPWKWMKDLYWNVRNFIHRGRYGYAYTDVWNFCDWYPRVGAEALRYLALHNSGYPGHYPWNTIDEWREYLNYLANRLERCANSQAIDFGEERNEYAEAFDELMERRRQEKRDAQGNMVWSYELTPEEEELRKKYFDRAKELANVDHEYNKETYRWIGEDIGRLWD